MSENGDRLGGIKPFFVLRFLLAQAQAGAQQASYVLKGTHIEQAPQQKSTECFHWVLDLTEVVGRRD
jgi:hypothetical protein